MEKLVSIITPCYNSSKTVRETIDSVLAQTYKNIELILVDDGSRDDTREVLKPYLEQYSFIRYFYQNNQGQSVARNKGVELAKGFYLLFLDSDDLIAPTYISKCVSVLDNQPDVKLVHSNGFYFGAITGDWIFPKYTFRNFLIGNMIHILALVRKQDFEDAGGFDVSISFYEDWDLWIKILKKGGEYVLIDEQLFFYRKREDQTSLTDKRDEEIDIKNKLKVYENNKDVYTRVFGTPIDMLERAYTLENEVLACKRRIERLESKRLHNKIKRLFGLK